MKVEHFTNLAKTRSVLALSPRDGTLVFHVQLVATVKPHTERKDLLSTEVRVEKHA